MKIVNLLNKKIGDYNPCYIIAEIGNLFKNFEEAKRLIDAAKDIGVDAVKFQTWDAETITTKSNFIELEVTGNVSQYEFHKKLQISEQLQKQIVDYANKIKLPIFSAPSHIDDLELIDKLQLPFYKIGSDLACHIPLLKNIAKKRKPIILSTGMCTLDEIRESVECILKEGNDQLILLHCISDYPAKIEESNLKAIIEMKKEFNIPIGFSDHAIGFNMSLFAATIGANVIEKHMRHPDNMVSPDDLHSLTPSDFASLIKSIRQMELTLGDGKKLPSKSEIKNLQNNRVSIISIQKIPKNAIIIKSMLDIRRPGTGIQPKFFEEILGRRALVEIENETPLNWNMIE